MDPRLVIIANRGPNDFVWQGGGWVTRPAAGGLVSMLEPLARQPDVTWFCCVSEPPDAEQAREGLYTTAADETDPELHVIPVPLPARRYQAYYGRISNEILWMIQHHIAGPEGFASLDAGRHQAWHDGYLAANRDLAAAVARTCPTAAGFLIQDYHLYPLPALLRAACPDTPSLHFTHIPFPDPMSLQLLPRDWRTTILEGMLGADVIGLQTEEDVQAFLGSCGRFLDVQIDDERAVVLAADGRRVQVRAFPASVDPQALAQTMRAARVAIARQRLAPAGADLHIIRVDRLDPSKNHVIGFQAFGRLLEVRPDLCGRVRFLAFLVPSRTDLGVYRAYRDRVYRTIDAINGRFAGACGGPPITVFYTNDREQALAALAQCDVLLVNSLADGMNLVAKEWALVSQRPGALIVSETAGVAGEAADSALLVSPLDQEGTAWAMARALDMTAEERAARLTRLRERVQRWTAADWLEAQLAALDAGRAVAGHTGADR